VISWRSIHAAPFVFRHGNVATWFLSGGPETLKVQASSAFDRWL
jgi:hypothetical protein